MELKDLMSNLYRKKDFLKKVENDFNSCKFERDLLLRKVEDDTNSLNNESEKLDLYSNSKEIINKIVLNTRNNAISFIENIVNCALLDVFGNDSLKLKLQLNSEGSKTSISTLIEENGNLYDIESSRGGGLRDLVSVAVLICCRALAKPKIELPLCLDESFKFLHSTGDNKFKSNAFKFLKEVANKLNIQIIIITGEEDKDALECADNIIFVEKRNGESYLKI